jgi:hypothetical protein
MVLDPHRNAFSTIIPKCFIFFMKQLVSVFQHSLSPLCKIRGSDK